MSPCVTVEEVYLQGCGVIAPKHSLVWNPGLYVHVISSSFPFSTIFSTPLKCLVTQKGHWSIYFFLFLCYFFKVFFNEWHQERRRNAWQLSLRLRSWLSEVQLLLKCRLGARRQEKTPEWHTQHFFLSSYTYYYTVGDRYWWRMDRQKNSLSPLWNVCNVTFINSIMGGFFYVIICEECAVNGNMRELISYQGWIHILIRRRFWIYSVVVFTLEKRYDEVCSKQKVQPVLGVLSVNAVFLQECST